MPKGTHFHQAHDAMGTDNKINNSDERILSHDKQDFQQSEKSKKLESRTEQEFIDEQDKQNEE